MLDRLRSATGEAHTALEDTLGLLQAPLRRERLVVVLQGFLTFHRDWEPMISTLLEDPANFAPRTRIALAERDLQALGGSEAQGVAGPFDLRFLSDVSNAWGSLYVMEGSTLGGLVISKALRGAAWAPDDGLSYFNPYGRRTAAMWAGFRSDLEAAAPGLDADSAVHGAQATFRTLRSGFADRLRVAA